MNPKPRFFQYLRRIKHPNTTISFSAKVKPSEPKHFQHILMNQTEEKKMKKPCSAKKKWRENVARFERSCRRYKKPAKCWWGSRPDSKPYRYVLPASEFPSVPSPLPRNPSQEKWNGLLEGGRVWAFGAMKRVHEWVDFETRANRWRIALACGNTAFYVWGRIL